MDIDLGSTIRRLRKRRKLTQEQLGALVGCTGAAVTMWESGQTKPAIARLPDLARALDTSVDRLLAGRAA